MGQQWPVVTSGITRVDATLLSSMLPTFTIKGSDTTKVSDVTLANDPDLFTDTLTAGGVYVVEFHIRFGALQAAGIKTTWLTPAGTSGNRDVAGPGSANVFETNANTTEMRWSVHGFGTTVAYTNPRNSIANQSWLYEKSLITLGATAGPVNFRWAQNASSATGSVVFSSSYARWQRVG